ncbi:MAG: VPLPA-CTERM sorting domain-containing protein [Pseudomonadota bacterium]
MGYKILLNQKSFLLYLFLLGFGSTASYAALIETELPNNAFITFNNFDWAWGASCITKNAGDCDTIDSSFQEGLGWRIATSQDMSLAPAATDFLFEGGNVPFDGIDPVSGAAFEFLNDVYLNAESAGACASSYFTLGDGRNTCDWQNGGGQDVNSNGWYTQNGETRFFADVLFIRDTAIVPVPAAVWLLGSAMIGLIGYSKRKVNI